MLRSFFIQKSHLSKKNNAQEIMMKVFLRHVINGEQKRAQEMLNINPQLALNRGTIVDHAGKLFKERTGFQCAIWTLDRGMWCMIKSYLPNEVAKKQGINGGESFNIHPLFSAYETYIKHPLSENWLKVGIEQRKLPLYFLKQYYHPLRSFFPVPNFMEEDTDYVSQMDININALGISGAIARGDWARAQLSSRTIAPSKEVDRETAVREVRIDYNALKIMYNLCIRQKESLMQELISVKNEQLSGSSLRM